MAYCNWTAVCENTTRCKTKQVAADVAYCFTHRDLGCDICCSTAENAKFAGPSDRRGYFLSGSGKHPSITGPCDRLIVHCSPFLPHACAKLHLQWVCQKASGSAKNLVSAGPVVWHIKKSFRILWVQYWYSQVAVSWGYGWWMHVPEALLKSYWKYHLSVARKKRVFRCQDSVEEGQARVVAGICNCCMKPELNCVD